jgi:hypothetical protein
MEEGDSPAIEDNGGVLGNLPRARPGTRSQRRTKGGGRRPAKAAAQAARSAERGGRPAARAARASPPRGAAGAAGSGGGSRRGASGDPVPRGASEGPVSEAVRAAAKLAGTGLRVTAGLAQEVLRRLPRS